MLHREDDISLQQHTITRLVKQGKYTLCHTEENTLTIAIVTSLHCVKLQMPCSYGSIRQAQVTEGHAAVTDRRILIGSMRRQHAGNGSDFHKQDPQGKPKEGKGGNQKL